MDPTLPNEPQPQYKLILLKTTPGSKCDTDENLKIIGFTMTGQDFKGIFDNKEEVTKQIVVDAINKDVEKMELDPKIKREVLINTDCSSKQKEPATSVSSVASETLPNNENGEEKSDEKTGDGSSSGGSKKQSKRNRKNRRNRRSQKK